MFLHVKILFGGNSNVFKDDVPGIGAGDTVGSGEVKVFEGDILDGTFFESLNHTAPVGASGSDMVNMNVAELGRAFGERFFRRLGVT